MPYRVLLLYTAFSYPILAPSSLLGRDVSHKYFKIQVVDDQTGRGVPLVELRTVNQIRYVTDSNGIVAFYEPGLMDQEVFFHITSHGYEFPKDGFGYRGTALKVVEGESSRLKIKRINIAERLYRVTGAGIYRDSLLTGHAVPTQQAALNAKVLGSDSVVNAVFRGKIYWFWGDTNRPGYPLGNFHVPGATSRLPTNGGLDPNRGIDFNYFLAPSGFAKETARMPGKGPTWIDGLVVLRDEDGRKRLFAKYVKIRQFLETYERGLVEFDTEEQNFHKVVEFDMDAPLYPRGHPFLHQEGDTEYIYFPDPFPLLRVRANIASFKDPNQYEAYTCLKQGSRLLKGECVHVELDRDKDGKLRYGWKRDTPVVGQREQAALIRAGKMGMDEALLGFADIDTGKTVLAHRSSVYWNDYRRRWAMIATESGGSSLLGEVWYSEAKCPTGPWRPAKKIVTHDRYSFYNPKQHPMLIQKRGRFIFFEGTYTHTFSGNRDQTPRYDYNQVMYRLDLADPRLELSGE